MSVFISCLKINCCLCNDASVIPEIASSLKLVFGWLWLVFILCKCNSGCSGEMSMSKNVFIWLNHSVINWIAHTHFAICHVADLYPLKLVFSDIEASEGLWSLRTLYIIVWCCFCPFLLYLDPSTFLPQPFAENDSEDSSQFVFFLSFFQLPQPLRQIILVGFLFVCFCISIL